MNEIENDIKTNKVIGSTSSKVVLLSFILSTLALVLLSVFIYQIRLYVKHFQDSQTRIYDMIHSSQETIGNNQSKIQEYGEQLEQNSQILNKITDLTNVRGNAWIISEANYLADLAQLALQFEGNVDAALVLLQSADKLLSHNLTENFLAARTEIAKSIGELRAVPKLDLAGILTKLNSLADAVQSLSLLPQFQTPNNSQENNAKENAKESPTVQPQNIWQNAWDNSRQALSQVLVIRHHQQNLEPLLTNNQYLYLQQNIQLQLQIAQWAALHQQQTIYQNSLKRAGTWIAHYFADNGMASRSILQTLTELQGINVHPDLPDLTNTLTVIQGLGDASKPANATVSNLPENAAENPTNTSANATPETTAASPKP